MNSQLTTCFLHSSQIQYFCQDCDISLCETCLLTQHYQHTLTYYVPNQDLKLKNLNGKHIKWLQEQEQEVDVLQKIIQFQIQEKQKINLIFNKPQSKSNYLQISNQILNSDHQTIVFNFIEKIITQNKDFQYEDQQQLYLNAFEYKLNQNLWQKLCLQLSLSDKLQILSINLCSSTLNTNLLQKLIESISNLQNLLYVELDMQHTYLDDNSIQVLFGVMRIPNLLKFIAYVSQCNITVDTLHQFWNRNKEQIKEKFNYFYIYHHFCNILYIFWIDSFGHDKDFYEEIMASKSSIYLDQFSESTTFV